MRLFRSLVITSTVLAAGFVANVSVGQTLNSRYVSQQDLNDPMSLKPWSIDTSSLFLFRSDPGSKALLTGDSDPTNSVDADDLSYGFAYGYLVRLERQLTSRTRFETRFFGTDDWDDRSTTSTTTDVLLSGGEPVGFTESTIQSQLSSKLYSLELNINHDVTENIEAIFGFRYLRLKDNLSLNSPTPSFPLFSTTLQTEASNDLFGGQMGARARLWEGQRFSMTTDFKGGVYGNGAHQRTSVSTLGVPSLAAANDFNDTVAFVGEWTLQGNYQLTERWSVDVGYQLLWIDGVAVGTEQLAASNLGLGGSGDGIDSHDHVFYQGILLGLDYTW